VEERPFDERRLIAAVVLSLVVLTAYRLLLPTPAGGPPARPAPPAGAPPASAGAETPRPEPSPVPTPEPRAEPVAAEREQRVELETAEAALAFSNRGARLISWRLKAFRDGEGRGEEMVPQRPGALRPLDLETGDAARDARLREALFVPSASELSVPRGREGRLVFRYGDGTLSAEKGIRIESSGALASVWAVVREGGRSVPARLLWGPGIGNPTAQEREVQGYQAPQGVYLAAGSVTRVLPGKLEEARSLGAAAFVGVESQYFAALFVSPASAVLRRTELPAQDKLPAEPAVAVAVAASGPEAALPLYVGAKDHARLSRLGHELARVVPVGDWIGPIVVLLMRLLRWVHSHVGSYGWSIVLLTVVINLVLSPFRHVSIANGVKMAKMAPEMKVIQERYRGIPALDKRREQMQREMGALYAKHGMSMGGQMLLGCLPLLLTMPFLIAFYRVLSLSVELRGAGFLWMPDLSRPDPFYLTPVLMGASMYVMQKMTPTAMDPQQQRIMALMPLVLSVMFFYAPGGLNLYWLASNLCSIVQQAVTLRLVRAGEARKRA
jgi:YidC/Oxa1 family membrane protein insertase